MTHDDIIRMAREYGVTDENLGSESRAVTDYGDVTNELIAFAEMIAAVEREACADLRKDAMEIFNTNPGETPQETRDVIEWYSAAIRARGPA